MVQFWQNRRFTSKTNLTLTEDGGTMVPISKLGDRAVRDTEDGCSITGVIISTEKLRKLFCTG